MPFYREPVESSIPNLFQMRFLPGERKTRDGKKKDGLFSKPEYNQRDVFEKSAIFPPGAAAPEGR